MAILKLDPTRTTTIRKMYMREMRKRFYEVRSLIIKAINELDVLGLRESQPLGFNQLINNQLPAAEAWRFQTNAEKLASFKVWLQEQIDNHILSVDGNGNPFSATYIDSAYRKGVASSYANVVPEAAGESLEFFRGSREQFLDTSFAHGERLSKLEFLYTRSFEELTGITNVMSQRLSRILANGIAEGLNPRVIARQMSNDIRLDILPKRALTLARTEIIAAHSEGQLDALEELGVERVKPLAEWSTAGDDRVCPLCEPLDGAVMTIKEARGLIPRHPNCRCAWIPADVGERTPKEIATARKKTKGQVDDSLKAELPKKSKNGDPTAELKPVPQTLPEAKKRSDWPGSEVTIRNEHVHNHLVNNEQWFTDYMQSIKVYNN